MTLQQKTVRLLPSILDRLTHDTNHSFDVYRHPLSQQLQQLREHVRRDLENLLNTRPQVVQPPQGLNEAERSLINYGVPDTSTVNTRDQNSKELFLRQIAYVIQQFEPRLRDITIIPLAVKNGKEPILRFRIEASLHASPWNETLVFDSRLDPTTRSITIDA